MFWKKKTSGVTATEETCAHALFVVLAKGLQKNGRIRAEDLITSAASITAELCIEAAGDFNPRKHQFIPGSRVFSTKVNELFSGDTDDIEIIPAASVVGTLRDRLLQAEYCKSDFPPLGEIFKRFAASVGSSSDWGKVPWSVPEENKPFVLPLRVAYATRSTVDQAFQSFATPQQKLRASVLTLAEALIAVQRTIDKKVALLLALETVNGMAKTAPMTDEAMNSLKKKGSEQ